MRELSPRINPKDPSRLRSTENRRVREAAKDLQEVIDRITERVTRENITDPRRIDQIVEEEMSRYQNATTQKSISQIKDTIGRTAIRSEQLVKSAGLKISPFLGPRPISSFLMDTLTLNVQNQIDSLSSSTKAKISATLIKGMNEGETHRAIANKIVENTGMELNRAKLIARDQTLKANRAAALDQYKKYGIELVKWYTAKDDRVCPECNALHGKVFPIDEVPEVHGGTGINCRCIQLPEIPEAA
jgi:SPP1 gp7 family putative phage head morphogenesis protein